MAQFSYRSRFMGSGGDGDKRRVLKGLYKTKLRKSRVVCGKERNKLENTRRPHTSGPQPKIERRRKKSAGKLVYVSKRPTASTVGLGASTETRTKTLSIEGGSFQLKARSQRMRAKRQRLGKAEGSTVRRRLQRENHKQLYYRGKGIGRQPENRHLTPDA